MPSKNTDSPSKRTSKSRRRKPLVVSNSDVEKRIILLLEKAEEVIKNDMEMAQNYALQAKRLQMRTRVRFPSQWTKRFCKQCKSFLYPGINSQVRLTSSNKIISIKCFHCNGYTRIPYYHNVEEKDES